MTLLLADVRLGCHSHSSSTPPLLAEKRFMHFDRLGLMSALGRMRTSSNDGPDPLRTLGSLKRTLALVDQKRRCDLASAATRPGAEAD